MEKRITWIDTVRGGAMICVVLGHLGVGFINDIVYAFHMPVFFMLTGYMVRINQKELDCKVVQKKIFESDATILYYMLLHFKYGYH